MRKILKWIGIVVGALLVLVIVVALGAIVFTDSLFNRTYAVEPVPITIVTDAESLATGRHWSEMHCQVCHGEDLGGGPFFNDPQLGYVDAPNLTAGRGGIGATYSTGDWVRAIRHGIRLDGKSVFIMPSQDFYYLNDTDLGGIIAYVSTVPPVDRETRSRGLSPMAKILYAAGAFGDLLYAGTIAHDVRPPAPPVGVTVEYGDYLARAHGCHSCHGELLTGKQPSEPGAPFAPNLTPGGDLANWTEADFVTTLRTGITPTGWHLSDSMPWQGLGLMTDAEISALWLYLQSQPALPSAQP